MSNTYEIPYWNKYTLSIEEAAGYFRIGECKLRKIITENPTADYILWNGNRMQIKRKKFEEFIDKQSVIQRVQKLKEYLVNIYLFLRKQYNGIDAIITNNNGKFKKENRYKEKKSLNNKSTVDFGLYKKYNKSIYQ